MARPIRKYIASIRNLEYRLRAFKDFLPDILEDIIRKKEDVIVSAIANDQLYCRGINGKGQKIMDYAPYTARTIANKIRKHQPHTRVTLRDTGSFHENMHIVFEPDGFYVTSSDTKTDWLTKKYRLEIFRLTNENFNRLLKSHIRKELVKHAKQKIKGK